MQNIGKFCDHLEYVTAIWYNFWPFGLLSFGIFSPIWYVWRKKNLATLFPERNGKSSRTWIGMQSAKVKEGIDFVPSENDFGGKKNI
jgi:hypothetical protein